MVPAIRQLDAEIMGGAEGVQNPYVQRMGGS
jgi:hypothetical protein